MAKRTAAQTGVTLTATNDSTDLANASYPLALQGIATQMTYIYEVYMGGQSTSSAPTMTCLAFDSQVGSGSLTKTTSTSTSNLTDTGMSGLTTALVSGSVPTVFNNTATNKPQRDTAKILLPLSFNAFGGVVRWLAAPGEEVVLFGATASFGEVSLSARAGGAGIVSAHMIFETV
jgi:hypothetical protein